MIRNTAAKIFRSGTRSLSLSLSLEHLNVLQPTRVTLYANLYIAHSFNSNCDQTARRPSVRPPAVLRLLMFSLWHPVGIYRMVGRRHGPALFIDRRL